MVVWYWKIKQKETQHLIKCLYCMTIRCQNRCPSSDTADSESALLDEFRRRSLQQQQQRQWKHLGQSNRGPWRCNGFSRAEGSCAIDRDYHGLDDARRSNTGRYSGMMWNESICLFQPRISEVTYVICNMLAPKVLSGRKVKTYKHINPGSPWFTCWEWDTHEIQRCNGTEQPYWGRTVAEQPFRACSSCCEKERLDPYIAWDRHKYSWLSSSLHAHQSIYFNHWNAHPSFVRK